MKKKTYAKMSKTGTVIAADTRKKAPGKEVRVMTVVEVALKAGDTNRGISVDPLRRSRRVTLCETVEQTKKNYKSTVRC